MRFRQISTGIIFLSTWIILCVNSIKAQTIAEEKLIPLLNEFLQDARYGPHERNVLDLWLAKSDKPTPLVLYIHGGGFRQGDKKSINKKDLKDYLEAGFSVAAINYRLTNTAPAPAAYLDCGRALQFLRFNAEKWNIDPELIASTGGSAGAGTSMWLAFHDDLAEPDSDDPPVLLDYRYPNEEVDDSTSLGHIVHHPRFGIALKKEMDKLGVECIVQYQDKFRGKLITHGASSNEEPISKLEFIKKYFAAAKKRK